MARPRRTLLRLASSAVAALTLGAALVVGTTGAANASPSVTSTVTIPTTCAGVVHRVAGGHMYQYVYRGMRFSRLDFGALTFGGVSRTPTTYTLALQTDTADVFFMVLDDGSLWRVTYNGSSLTSTKVVASGWAGVRHITASPTGTRIYALTTTGGLYRYSLSSTAQLRSLGAIATTGWAGIKYLSPSAPDDAYDSLVGVSTTGALRQYLVNRSTGATTGRILVAAGWGGMKHVSVGGCAAPSTAAPIIGFTTNGDAYGYYDRNAFDLNGSDIRGAGKLGFGFTGLLAD